MILLTTLANEYLQHRSVTNHTKSCVLTIFRELLLFLGGSCLMLQKAKFGRGK